MATWDELRDFVHRNWAASDVDERHLQLVFELPNLRSQTVLIEYAANDETDWVKFNSPIGELTEIDLWTASEQLSRKLLGGLMVEQGHVVVTNALPMANITGDEIRETMLRITAIADELEHQFLG